MIARGLTGGGGGLAGAVAMVALVAALALSSPQGNDYGQPECGQMRCNDAAPAIEALVDLDLREFAARQPAMGSLSLLVRAPFAGLAHALGGGSLAAYRLGALPCLLAAGLLGLALAGVARRRGAAPAAQVAVAAVCVLNPFVLASLNYGHPEEVLMAALVLGAALAALRGHPAIAGAMLGLALGTKLTAAVAVLPVLSAAAPRSRLRLAVVTVAVAGALLAPPALLAGERFAATTRSVAQSDTTVSPYTVWWPLSRSEMVQVDTYRGAPVLEAGDVAPAWVGRINRVLILALTATLTAAFLLTRRDRRPGAVLGLLALVLLLRCLLDPIDNAYYHVPAIAAIAAWETIDRHRLPLLAMGASAAAAGMHWIGDAATLNLAYLAWTVPLALYLAWSTFRPRLRLAPRPLPAGA